MDCGSLDAGSRNGELPKAVRFPVAESIENALTPDASTDPLVYAQSSVTYRNFPLGSMADPVGPSEGEVVKIVGMAVNAPFEELIWNSEILSVPPLFTAYNAELDEFTASEVTCWVKELKAEGTANGEPLTRLRLPPLPMLYPSMR